MILINCYVCLYMLMFFNIDGFGAKKGVKLKYTKGIQRSHEDIVTLIDKLRHKIFRTFRSRQMVPIFNIRIEIQIFCPFQQFIHLFRLNVKISIIKFILNHFFLLIYSFSQLLSLSCLLCFLYLVYYFSLLWLFALHVHILKPF